MAEYAVCRCEVGCEIKKARIKRAFLIKFKTELLQFHFLVIHVLASFGIKFFDQQFLGSGLLVFAGGVEVTGSGCRFQLDFFASAFGCHDVLSVG
jgi:hypothetical protein